MDTITEDEFYLLTGRKPEQDDLERVNCDKAGQIGHFSCGWCKIHWCPVFECQSSLCQLNAEATPKS